MTQIKLIKKMVSLSENVCQAGICSGDYIKSSQGKLGLEVAKRFYLMSSFSPQKGGIHWILETALVSVGLSKVILLSKTFWPALGLLTTWTGFCLLPKIVYKLSIILLIKKWKMGKMSLCLHKS